MKGRRGRVHSKSLRKPTHEASLSPDPGGGQGRASPGTGVAHPHPRPATQGPWDLGHPTLSGLFPYPPAAPGEDMVSKPLPTPTPPSQDSPGQEIHEQEQRQVDEDEQPEIQPVGVFGKPARRGRRLHTVVLLRPRRAAQASPLPGPVRAISRRRAPLHRAPAARRRPSSWKPRASRTSAFTRPERGGARPPGRREAPPRKWAVPALPARRRLPGPLPP